MGWWSYDIYGSPKEECDKCYNSPLKRDGLKGRDRVLCSCMKGNVYYAAVERTWEDGTPREVWAAVALTYYNPRVKKGFNFSIKEIDESMEPFYYDMPEKYLNLLTETDNEAANRWREKCRVCVNKRKKLKSVPIGGRIKFKSPYRLISGVEVGDEVILTKYKWGKRSRWHNGYYRWTENMIPVEFEILN